MFYFWKFVHNAVVHPLLAFPYEPQWVQQFHDWTASKMAEGEYEEENSSDRVSTFYAHYSERSERPGTDSL